MPCFLGWKVKGRSRPRLDSPNSSTAVQDNIDRKVLWNVHIRAYSRYDGGEKECVSGLDQAEAISVQLMKIYFEPVGPQISTLEGMYQRP